MSNRIDVEALSGNYEAVAGKNILEEELLPLLSRFSSDKLFLLVDENVWKHHESRLIEILKTAAKELHVMQVPSGEQSKSISFWSQAIDFLLNNRVRRNTPVIVAGGGVTGDVGGFAAAAALRGVPLIHLPTTLLAMVDSSIGGKTGINHAAGKNLIGAFYQPAGVIADTAFLSTLPETEWINGLSEILKYGAIRDASIFDDASFFLEENFRQRVSPVQLSQLISKCIRVKADIVKEDEFESGVRAFLNFGHTFAHALEKACSYSTISHGEAVYLGMLAAQKLSNLEGGNVHGDFIKKFSGLYHYRVSKEALSLVDLISYMKSDKKRTDKQLRFVLLKEWQHPELKSVLNHRHIEQSAEAIFEELV
jgi:3-dehydroquinate synthase